MIIGDFEIKKQYNNVIKKSSLYNSHAEDIFLFKQLNAYLKCLNFFIFNLKVLFSI